MEVTVEHLGEVQFEIRARDHVVACDQPKENGGFDEGMTPPELLLASLGSCAAYYAAEYLKRKQLASEGTRVRVSAEKVKNPPRMENFQIAIGAPVPLNDAQRGEMEQAVHRCLIHNTLLHPPRITIDIHDQVSASA
jgi:putative redox protein